MFYHPQFKCEESDLFENGKVHWNLNGVVHWVLQLLANIKVIYVDCKFNPNLFDWIAKLKWNVFAFSLLDKSAPSIYTLQTFLGVTI